MRARKVKKNSQFEGKMQLKVCEQRFYVAVQRPYLALAIDADVQRVSLASGAVDDCRRALRVEVVALCQAVQSAGLNATCFKENAHRRRRCLSPVGPAHRGTTTRTETQGFYFKEVKSECFDVKHIKGCQHYTDRVSVTNSYCLSRVWTQLNRIIEASTSQKKRKNECPRFAF